MRFRWANMLRQFWVRSQTQTAAKTPLSRRSRGYRWRSVEPMEARVLLAGDPTLRVVLASPSMSELAGGNGVQATVERFNTDTSQPLTVSLFSSDTSEASVPATVTIPAFSSTANFFVLPVDDALLDGPQTLQITAAAPGFTYASSTPNSVGLDTSFGTNGYSTVPLNWSLSNVFPDVLVQPDGSVLALSQTPGSSTSWRLARRTANGAIDFNFGSDGAVTTTFANTTQVSPNSLAVQADGKILAAGMISGGTTVWNDLTVVRYLSNGQLDTTFGNGGIARIERSTHTNIYDMAVLDNGSILLAGVEGVNGFVAKLTPGGIFDQSFGFNGVVATTHPGYSTSSLKSLLVQDDGKIVVAGSGYPAGGSNYPTFLAARLLPNGTFDTSFDGDGRQQIDTSPISNSIGVVRNAALQSDGKLVLVGYDGPGGTANENWAIVRLSADGTLDASFSGDGMVILDHAGSSDYANDVEIQPDGRILVMGEMFVSGNGYDTAVARFNTDGTLDTTFDNDGKIIFPNWTGTIWEQIWAGDLDANGNLVFLAGYNNDMRLSRLNLNTASPIRDQLTVTDHETLTVTILPTSVSEAAGTVTATITRSNTADLNTVLIVEVTSSDTTELTVPVTVIVPSGYASVTFPIDVVNDDAQDGTQSVVIQATATGYFSMTDTLSVIDDDTNLAPVAANQSKSMNEDGVLTGQATATDAEGDALTYSLATGPAHGQVIFNSDGTYTYTPDPNYFGNDSFQFRAFDGRTNSNAATVFINVQAVNDAPVAVDDSYTLDEDTVLTAALPAQPVTQIQMTSDPGDWIGQGRSYNLTTGITGQVFNNGSYVRIRYRNPNNSSDYFDFEFESPYPNQPLTVGTYLGATRYPFNPDGTPGLSVTGQGRGSNTLTGFFTVQQISFNNVGQLLNFAATFEQHSEGSTPALRGTVQFNNIVGGPAAGVLVNDADVENHGLSAWLVNSPQHGSVTLNPNGTFSYTPQANYHGPDSFTYVANDGSLFSNVATVSLTVNPVDDAPTIGNYTFNVDENTAGIASLGWLTATDGDEGQTVTFAITGSTHPGTFAIDPNTGEFTVVDGTLLNYEQATTATVTVTATDSGNPARSSSATVTVNITDINEHPLITTEALSIDENAANGTSVGFVQFTDQDVGQDHVFYLVSDGSNGALQLNSQTGELTVANGAMLNHEMIPHYELAIGIADNGSPILSTLRTVTVFVNDINDAPTLFIQSMGVEENAYEFQSVGVVYGFDADPGQTLTYSISNATIPGALAISPTDGFVYVANGALLDFEATPTISFTLSVTDNGSPALTTSQVVTIPLIDKNEAPTVSNYAFSVAENSANGTVVGTVTAQDIDAGQTLTYYLDSRPLEGAFAIDAQTGQITVTDASLLNYEAVQSVTFQVGVVDSGAAPMWALSLVTIDITNANDAPVMANQTVSVREYLNQGSVVATMAATDEDAGQSIGYSIVSSTLPGAFMITLSGQILVSNGNVLDYETVGSATLTVRATDNGNPARFTDATVRVNITDVNESPTMDSQSFSVAENAANGTVVGTVIAGDVDIGQSLTYEILSSPVPGAFAINAATGQITVANGSLLNYESRTSIELGVQAYDNGVPSLATIAPITINITNVNEAPTVTGTTFTIAENSAVATAVGTVSASDPDAGQTRTFAITGGNTSNAFAINSSTGAITVSNPAALNFESTPSFSLTVTATDNGNPALSGAATVTVNLTNVNEAPAVTAATFSVAENSAVGTAVGTVSATDPDAGQSRTYAIIAGNTNNAFAINAATGAITVNSSAALNFESLSSYGLTVRATDNGNPALSGTGTVTVNVTNVNEAPVVSPATFTVAENSATGTNVGTVTATDPDAGQLRIFAITAGNINNAFAINPATGVITVSNPAALNYESATSFTLTVQATDNGSPALSATATVRVNITNVNEAPIVAAQSFAVKTKSKAGVVVGTVVSSDPDAGQTRTYTIVSGNGSSNKPVFEINATTGVIKVKTASGVASPGTYTLGVRATDNGSPSLSTTGTIRIYVNSSGTVPVGARSTGKRAASSLDEPITVTAVTLDSSQKLYAEPTPTKTVLPAALPMSSKLKSGAKSLSELLARKN